MSKYLQAYVSAENDVWATKILNFLLEKNLVAGGLVTHGPSKYWWKGKIVGAEYYNLSAFTIAKNKQAIIKEVKNITNEEVPMIWFIGFEGNKEFTDWVDKSVK